MTPAAWTVLLLPSWAPAQTLVLEPLSAPPQAALSAPAEAPALLSLDPGPSLKAPEAGIQGLAAPGPLARPLGAARERENEASLPFTPLEVNGARGRLLGASLAASARRAREAWSSYRANFDRARSFGSPIVEEPKGLFVDVYGIGQLLGTRTTIGLKISTEVAARSARRALRRHFVPKAPEAAPAFERFLARAREVDAGSPNRFRKRLQEALFEASLLPPSRVAGWLDAKVDAAYRSKVELFRRLRQGSIVDSFAREAEALLVREERAHPGPDRFNIAGVLVTGSLVYGSGLPESDLDFYLLTRDGTSRHTERFMERLEELRRLKGWPDWPDKARHPFALGVDGPLAPRLASEFRSIVATPHAEIARTYGAIALSRPFHRTSALQRLVHRLAEPLYRLLLRWLLSG